MVPPNELRNPARVLAHVGLGENDGAGLAQACDECRVVRRAIVGVGRIRARRRAHVEGVVLILDGDDDAVKRADELPGLRELRVEFRRDFERVRHGGIGVDRVGHAARLARVEAPLLARGGT